MILDTELCQVKDLAMQINDAVRHTLPTKGERLALRKRLFELGRRLKDVGELDAEKLDEVADEWHRRAGEAVADVDTCEVREKVKNAYAKARYGFDAHTLKAEHAKRQAEPLSETAAKFCNPRLRAAVQACEAAQRMNPDGDFAMPGAKLGELIGVSQVQAAEHLRTLREAGVLVMTADAEFKRKARRYRLVPVVKTVAQSIRDVLGAVAKLAARFIGTTAATSAPAAEPTDAGDEGDWIDGSVKATYEPPAVVVGANGRATLAGREPHERNGEPPKRRRANRWRTWTWAELKWAELMGKSARSAPDEPEPI